MFEDWNTSDDLKKDIITAVYQDINDQVEEMAKILDVHEVLQKGC